MARLFTYLLFTPHHIHFLVRLFGSLSFVLPQHRKKSHKWTWVKAILYYWNQRYYIIPFWISSKNQSGRRWWRESPALCQLPWSACTGHPKGCPDQLSDGQTYGYQRKRFGKYKLIYCKLYIIIIYISNKVGRCRSVAEFEKMSRIGEGTYGIVCMKFDEGFSFIC